MKKLILLLILTYSQYTFAQNQTYSCMETVSLTGKLSFETTSDPRYDEYVPVKFPAINLSNPINVVNRNNANDFCDDKYENIKLLQLGLREQDYALLKKNIGKTAQIKCELNPSETAHHHTNPWCYANHDNQLKIIR